ncbi:iron-containing alcohol dehydrogenase family protein [Nocardia harenae]|uniref:iron-containing alcohol dehydrogenase family protein n=1 Tax=Nocardia harenae TaxID=358707 RepID=UPI000835765B|nr:iron-containing alcohol dehydrogenase [Nocardia harenae]
MASADIAEFLFPRKVVRRAGASAEVGALLSAQGVRSGSVFIVADRFVHESGMTSALIAGLHEAGFETRVFSGIVGEPNLDMVQEAAASAAAVQAVAVIGMGGGSALDTAKLVSYQTVSGASLRELKGPVPFLANLPALVMIPTTTGTGAEATKVAMFAVDGAKRAVLSAQFVPDIAVLDADLVADLPPAVLAATALDALSHAIESMMSTTSNELTWHFSGEAARRIFAQLPRAFDGDREARSDLLYASFLAGVSLNAGVTLGHSMSYILAARHHLAHGVGCALALPFALAYNQLMPAEEADDIARLVLDRPDATLRELAEDVQRLTAAVGIPTDLTGFGAEDESSTLGPAVARDYPRPTNPVALEPERLALLFSHLRTGDLAGAWTAMGVPA